jgi:hypothetical protein
VHDPVAKRRRGDDTRLALIDREQAIVAGPIAPVLQLALQQEKLALEIQVELRDGQTSSFAPARFPRCDE